MSLDERPPPVAVALVGVIGAVATSAMVPAGTPLLAGALGTALAAIGVALCSRRALAVGATLLGAGAVAAGLYGLGGIGTATAALGCLLVWDVGDQAISVTAHVGRGGRPMAAIGVHAAASTIAAGSVLAVVAGLAGVTTGGQPVVALVLALVGGLFVVGSFRL